MYLTHLEPVCTIKLEPVSYSAGATELQESCQKCALRQSVTNVLCRIDVFEKSQVKRLNALARMPRPCDFPGKGRDFAVAALARTAQMFATGTVLTFVVRLVTWRLAAALRA
jgi:hypothetical protein